MLIKAIVQWLDKVPSKGAFIPHAGLRSRYLGRQTAGEAQSPSAGARQPRSLTDCWREESGPSPHFRAHRHGPDLVVASVPGVLYPPVHLLGFRKGFVERILVTGNRNTTSVNQKGGLLVFGVLLPYSCCMGQKVRPEHRLPGQGRPQA